MIKGISTIKVMMMMMRMMRIMIIIVTLVTKMVFLRDGDDSVIGGALVVVNYMLPIYVLAELH